jgi:hypothetical protein
MRMTRFAVLLAVLASPLLGGCGAAVLGAGTAYASVEVTRTPGLFILPAVDQTIDDQNTVRRLQADIDRLPPFPAGAISCPIDFGTSYKLVFMDAGLPTETAVVSAQGCQGVTLGDGRVLWAVNAPSLYTDLGTALGLSSAQLIPFPCPPPQGTVCFQQP